MKKNICILSFFLVAFLFSFTTSLAGENWKDRDNDVAQHNDWQGKGRFNPEQYQKDLEAFITKEAKLTQQEAAKFFPLLREMQKKMRDLGQKQRSFWNKDAFCDEKAAMAALKNSDNIDIQIKKLQQEYHLRFMKVIPATKVLCCIHAEERFNRNMMRNMANSFKK